MWVRLTQTSDRLAKGEKSVVVVLTALLLFLILLNVVTRSLSLALYWVDELAIYVMIWLVLIGASVTIHERSGIAVTLGIDAVSPSLRRLLLRIIDILVLAVAAALLVLSWIWYDPIALAAHGFDAKAFAAKTFNFIYADPTTTLGVPKFLIWSIMPLVSLTMTLHALANLFRPHPAKQAATAET